MRNGVATENNIRAKAISLDQLITWLFVILYKPLLFQNYCSKSVAKGMPFPFENERFHPIILHVFSSL